MSYAKFVKVLLRTNFDNINRIRLTHGRFRSSATSTHRQELTEKEAQIEDCKLGKPVQVELISQTKGSSDAQSRKIAIDFDNTNEAYKSKDNVELLRSILVFKLCTFDFLVDKNKELMDISKKVFGQWLFEKLMKMTFYGQFVAGEDHNSIKPLIRKNQAYGVGAVLDYSVEEDLTQEEAETKEME